MVLGDESKLYYVGRNRSLASGVAAAVSVLLACSRCFVVVVYLFLI